MLTYATARNGLSRKEVITDFVFTHPYNNHPCNKTRYADME